jgi:hypothetical protein
MAARTFVVDASGVSRLTKRWIVVDSSGTTRILKRAFIIDSGGAARLIFNAFTAELFTFNTPGSTLFTIPDGASTVEIEAIGSTTSGSQGFNGNGQQNGGAGAGSGGLTRSLYACAGLQTLNLLIGAAGTPGSGAVNPTLGGVTQVTSGSLIITPMSAQPGGAPTRAILNNGGAHGTGGGASGGNLLNQSGNNGEDGGLLTGTPGAGGIGLVGDHGSGPNGGHGGGGATISTGLTNGLPGFIALFFR